MKAEFEKKMRIVSDMLSYCHTIGATEFHIDVTEENDTSVFVIKASPANISDEEMEHLKKKLGAPRHREVEQNYWGLMGESANFSEPTLVGVMSDEASAELENHVLTVTLKRHK